MAIIFDGKTYALKKKELLKVGVKRLREEGIIPHLATIIVGDDKASLLYVDLKKKFIESLKAQVDIYVLSEKVSLNEIFSLIDSLNDDETVHGIMVQLPLPVKFIGDKDKIIERIDSKKDVDGLKENSSFLHPTSKAVLEILSLAVHDTKKIVESVCVIGASGMVGGPLVTELKKLGLTVFACDKDTKDLAGISSKADCVISATGVMNLVTPAMVKDEAIVIDVGSPHGDVNLLVPDKVSFITPVPGGVGPVTITCLAENLLTAC